MNFDEKKACLTQLLTELGIRVCEDRGQGEVNHFPFLLELANGSVLTLDLETPTPIDCLDEREIGIAILDSLGKVKFSWGLAKRHPAFRTGKSVLNSVFGSLPECLVTGDAVNFYHDGYRIYGSALGKKAFSNPTDHHGPSDVFVLVVNASQEKGLLQSVHQTERHALALRRLGKAMAVEEGPIKVAIAAAHEIASCGDLAAVLIWVLDEASQDLRLAASVGVNRAGQVALAVLSHSDMPFCLAELSAFSRKEVFYEDLGPVPSASELEARFCYLKPGGLGVFPLIAADRTVGVLEILGKSSDTGFASQKDLFLTFAEQLTLALNAALMYESAERRASHDALTGLANHKSAHEFLTTRLAESKRTGQPLGVLMLDVDHFRAFNEEEGHDAGDTVLKLVADAIKQCLRPYDLAARYGGEEFMVVVPNSGSDYVANVAERIRERIEAQTFVTPSGEERSISASVGAAIFPDNQTEAADLLRAADAALYRAKKAGRNQVVFWEGLFEAKENSPRPDINVDEWIVPELKQQSEELADGLQGEIEFLVRKLGLSEGQREILKGLSKIGLSYQWWMDHGNLEAINRFDSDGQMRTLVPSLHCLKERFDGSGARGLKGKKIPLLGRILPILMALGLEKGESLLRDPSRFDSEIVNLLADISSAA